MKGTNSNSARTHQAGSTYQSRGRRGRAWERPQRAWQLAHRRTSRHQRLR